MTEEEALSIAPQWGAQASPVLVPYSTYNVEITRTDEVVSVPHVPGISPAVTVHLWRNDQPEQGGTDPAYAYIGPERHAIVRYSSGASRSEFVCDWVGQFSLCCRSISVQLANHFGDTNPTTNPAHPRTQQRWGVHIGTEAVATTACPTYTTGKKYLASNGGSFDTLPRFAARYFPLITGYVSDSASFVGGINVAGYGIGTAVLEADLARIEIAFASIHGVYHSRTALTPELLRSGIRVPANATTIMVLSSLLIKAYSFRHCFELAI